MKRFLYGCMATVLAATLCSCTAKQSLESALDDAAQSSRDLAQDVHSKAVEAAKRARKALHDAFEPNAEQDFDYVVMEDGTGIQITNYRGEWTNVTVPAEIDGLPVIYVEFGPAKEGIESVSIPEGVTEIGRIAGLLTTDVSLPSTLKRIGDNAFWGAESLTELNIPDGVEYIGENSFFGSGITTLTLPQTVTRIGASAFENCQDLQTITLSDNIESLPWRCFENCTSLTQIRLPAKLKKIDGTTANDGAFKGCTALQTITVPDGIHTIAWPQNASAEAIKVFADCPLSAKAIQTLKDLGYKG